MKRIKRVYKVYTNGEVCVSTCLRDVFRFLARHLLSSNESSLYPIEIAVFPYE